MKLRSQEPYWLLKNGLINSYQSLTKNITCDILIIGSGITGSLMAYQFAQEGFKTVVVDKRDVGFGSTSATTAMLQYEIDEPLIELINRVGEKAAVDTYLEGIKCIDKLEKIIKKIKADCDFDRKQSLYVAHLPSEEEKLFKEYKCRLKYGIDVSWLSKTEIKRKFGVVGYGAILSSSAGTMDAYSLAHSLLNYAVKKFSLQVYDHTSIDEVVYQQKRNIAKTDGEHTITCKKIIYATGYEAQGFLKEKIVDLISTYAFISEPMNIDPVYSSTIFWDTQDPYLYMRTTSDHRIIIGGGDVPFKNPLLRDKLLDKKELFLLKSIQKFIPSLSIIPDFRWAGTFGVTKDALPYIGAHPSYPNSYFILGFGGNGITFSVMGMSTLSDAIQGKKNKFLEYFKFNR